MHGGQAIGKRNTEGERILEFAFANELVSCIKVWKLRDPGKQAELSEVFKAKTLDSELSQTSTVDECWTSLKDKLLQATKQVCGVSSNHPWRKQTWRWNKQ